MRGSGEYFRIATPTLPTTVIDVSAGSVSRLVSDAESRMELERPGEETKKRGEEKTVEKSGSELFELL
ncbi:hypothetical protein Ancab_013334 [Ancistrocladus abbreviatus]